jgi:hypothetical protein
VTDYTSKFDLSALVLTMRVTHFAHPTRPVTQIVVMAANGD